MDPRIVLLVQIAALSILISLPAGCGIMTFVREVPYATHFVVFLWVFARSAFVFLVMPLVAALSGRINAAASTGIGTPLTLIGTGWLVTRGLRALSGCRQISRNGDSENDSIARPFVMGNRWHSLCRLAGASEGVNFTWP